ncbi:MAG: hypothetical protein C0605_16190 [Hyphomicrobiales bacterium]|nr:MAG: hypothetical protein C0605_16190 [Hyphomicrobiales bacterium]
MTNKNEKPADHQAAAQALNDEELDQVQGGAPLAYPDVGTSSSGGGKKVKTSSVKDSSSSGDEGGSKGLVSNKTESTSHASFSNDVKVEGDGFLDMTQNGD